MTTAVLVIVALALIAMCVATRKGKNADGTDQQDNANRQPYYRMPMGGIYNNIQENTYSRIQREEEQPQSNQSYSVIYHQDSDSDDGDPQEGNRRTGSVSIIRNLSRRYGNRENRHNNGNNGNTEGGTDDKEPLYSQPRKKPKAVTTPVARGVVVDCDLFHTRSGQDNRRSGVDTENPSSTPPESLYSQVRDVKLLPMDLSVKDDITPSVLPLPANTRDT